MIGPLVVALAVGLGSIAGAAASTTTSSPPTSAPGTSTPPTSVPGTTAPPPVVILPPPPPFTPGDDFGRLLLQHRRDATAALAQANVDIATFTGEVALTRDHLLVAQHEKHAALEHAHDVAVKLVQIHDEIRELAAEAYMMGSSVQLTGALSSFASAHDFVALTRNLTLVRSSHDRLQDLIDYERKEQVRAAHRVDVAVSALADATQQYQTAQSHLADAQQRKADNIAALAQADRDQARFFDDATTSASPIMGPTRLSADDLVAYIDSLHLEHEPQLTVSLRTLAGYYISEGEAEGIRGDVAFAQSVLETGAFTFPGHGLLIPTDNNFAGIDACDSCKHGDLFETAQIGVRAQIQLLRIYADPTLEKIEDFAHPVALLHEPKLRSTGFAKTWYALGGRWATGPNYGFHVYDIYMQMLHLAQQRARDQNRPEP